MYSAFHPFGVGTMSRGELPLRGDEPRTFTKGLKRIGTNQGVATSQLEGTHIHAMHAGGWWQVWHFSRMIGWSSLSGPTQPSSFRGRYMSRGGTLGLPGGNSQALPRALKTWELSQRARGLPQWFSGNSRNCRP